MKYIFGPGPFAASGTISGDRYYPAQDLQLELHLLPVRAHTRPLTNERVKQPLSIR